MLGMGPNLSYHIVGWGMDYTAYFAYVVGLLGMSLSLCLVETGKHYYYNTRQPSIVLSYACLFPILKFTKTLHLPFYKSFI